MSILELGHPPHVPFPPSNLTLHENIFDHQLNRPPTVNSTKLPQQFLKHSSDIVHLNMSDIVSWWSACCAFTVMLLLGTVLLGRILAAVRIVAKAICSSGPARVISELARQGWDRCELSSTVKAAANMVSQV